MTIELHTWNTPNGRKISVALEEMGLPYKVVPINITKGEQMAPSFLAISPNNKIPAIVDPDGPGGQRVSMFESGAILLYLAEKSGQLLSADPALRYETIQWVFFQMGAMGPMFGQVGFFHKFAGREYEDKRPLHRYRDEAKRVLAVLEGRLADRTWVMGDDFTIADVSMLGWVRNLVGFYDAGELVGFDELKRVPAWLERGLVRPAVKRGLEIPKRG
jgi:GST-like protein